MSSFAGFKFSQVILVIMVSLVSLTMFPLDGYSSEWIYVGQNNIFRYFFNNENIKIDQQSKQIKVWVKLIWTKDGKLDYINKLKKQSIDTKNYDKFSHSLWLYLFDYNNMKYKNLSIVDYSTVGNRLYHADLDNKWEYINPESVSDLVINKILKVHNIKN